MAVVPGRTLKFGGRGRGNVNRHSACHNRETLQVRNQALVIPVRSVLVKKSVKLRQNRKREKAAPKCEHEPGNGNLHCLARS